MKHLFPVAILSLVVLPLAACNESSSEDMRDVRASERAVQKDQVAQSDFQSELAADRAAKADAKASGDSMRQAGKSVEIAADKTMIHEKRAERNVDNEVLEEDQEDLRH
jgi:hypothetical protein